MYSALKKFKKVLSSYVNKARTCKKYKIPIRYLNNVFKKEETYIWLLPLQLK